MRIKWGIYQGILFFVTLANLLRNSTKTTGKYMKKLSTLLATICIGLSTLSYAQVLEKGSKYFDIYYGYPELYTKTFNRTNKIDGNELNLKTGGTGPVGLRADFMLTDKISVGIDASYSTYLAKYNYIGQVANPVTGELSDKTYDYSFATNKIGALITGTYHIVMTDKFDLFGTAGFGYSGRKNTIKSTDEEFIPQKQTGLTPIGGKVGVGFRYFFTPNLGINFVLGAGQCGLISFGGSFKL